MANKVLIVFAAAALLAGGYAAGGGGGSFDAGGEMGAGKADPDRCRMLMRGFIDESRREDAAHPGRARDDTWVTTGRAIIKLNRIETVLRRNGCPYQMDEKTGKAAPFSIGLPGEPPRPGVFVPPSVR